MKIPAGSNLQVPLPLCLLHQREGTIHGLGACGCAQWLKRQEPSSSCAFSCSAPAPSHARAVSAPLLDYCGCQDWERREPWLLGAQVTINKKTNLSFLLWLVPHSDIPTRPCSAFKITSLCICPIAGASCSQMWKARVFFIGEIQLLWG